MPKNGNQPVFQKQTLTRTATQVPEAGADNHAPIDGSDGAWNVVSDTSFINQLSFGQEQDIILSADHVLQVQHSQLVNIRGAQQTTAQGEVTITSAGDQVYIEAQTQITLVVGDSKIVMARDGRIEISGKLITIKGDVIVSEAATQNTIIGKMVDINP